MNKLRVTPNEEERIVAILKREERYFFANFIFLVCLKRGEINTEIWNFIIFYGKKGRKKSFLKKVKKNIKKVKKTLDKMLEIDYYIRALFVRQRFGPIAQLVRAPACHAGGRRFEPVLGRQKCLGSSVGRAADWKSACRWFDSAPRHQLIVGRYAPV